MIDACSLEYYRECDPQALGMAGLLPYLAVGLLAFYGLVYLGVRFLPWERMVAAWRWQPRRCCDEASYGDYERRMLALGFVCLVGILAVPAGAAAPDAAPPLAWVTELPETENACNQISGGSAGDNLEPRHLSVSNDDEDVFVISICHQASDLDDVVVHKLTADGTVTWTSRIGCGSVRCNPQAVKALPDGNVSILYTPSGEKQVWKVLSGSTGSEIFNISTGFSFTSSATTGTMESLEVVEINATTFDNYMVVDSGSAGWGAKVRCSNGYSSTACTIVWEKSGSNITGQSVGWMTEADKLLVMDNDDGLGSGNGWLRYVNTTTGNVDTTTAAGVASATVLKVMAPWMLQNGTMVVWPQSATTNTGVRLDYYNGTLASLGRRTPTEPINPDLATWSLTGSYLDGSDSLFVCGAGDPNVNDNFVGSFAKYNTTDAPGMRWNISVDSVVVSSTSFEENTRDCEVSVNGHLYVIHGYEENCCVGGSWHGQVRKYSNAGTGRPFDSVFTGFTSTETPLEGDAATGLVNFCEETGFTSVASKFLCGLMLSATAAIVALSATAAVVQRSQVAVFMGGAVLLGMLVFVTIIGLWPIWSLVVLIIIAGAAMGKFANKVWGGGPG